MVKLVSITSGPNCVLGSKFYLLHRFKALKAEQFQPFFLYCLYLTLDYLTTISLDLSFRLLPLGFPLLVFQEG